MTKKILIINGPNLNLLGKREESKYGKVTLEEVKKNCESHAKSIGMEIKFVQSNIEGEIVTIIQKARDAYDGIIINAAGYTHTSVSILDALLAIKLPTIEVHITNIYNREEFRKKSLISNMKINKKIIEELTGYLKEFNLSEIEYGEGTTKVKVSRSINTSAVAPSEIKKKQEMVGSNGTNITSPIVGTAYLAPEPGGKKFVEIGQKIKKGQTIMIIEAMKTMNHVPSTQDGTVSKILVKDGEPVEFGQPLISVK